MKTYIKLMALGVIGLAGTTVVLAQGAPIIDVTACGRTLTSNIRSCSIFVPEPGGAIDKAEKPSGTSNGFAPKRAKDIDNTQGVDETPRVGCHESTVADFQTCMGGGVLPKIDNPIETGTPTTKHVIPVKNSD